MNVPLKRFQTHENKLKPRVKALTPNAINKTSALHVSHQHLVTFWWSHFLFNCCNLSQQNKIMPWIRDGAAALVDVTFYVPILICWLEECTPLLCQNDNKRRCILFGTYSYNRYLPENRRAPPTAMAVSVTSPPTKTCINPPKIRIHKPAISLEKSIYKKFNC